MQLRRGGERDLRVEKAETTDEVVFAEPGDLTLLACRALEGLHLRVDSVVEERRRRRGLACTWRTIACGDTSALPNPGPPQKVRCAQPAYTGINCRSRPHISGPPAR